MRQSLKNVLMIIVQVEWYLRKTHTAVTNAGWVLMTNVIVKAFTKNIKVVLVVTIVVPGSQGPPHVCPLHL